MAEGENNPNQDQGGSWESWLGGWMQTAKEKSSTALEMVKKDLSEFTCTMQKETEKVVEKTRESLKKENTAEATNRVKAGLTSFLDNISKALVIPPDDDYVEMKVAPDGSSLYDRGKARLHAIQLDASTYMDSPRGPEEQYKMWLESFSLDQHKGEISELLVSKVEVRALYTKLVPSEVSHAEFWQRYFYRVHQLECDEARKKALMQRAEQSKSKADSFSWDDDDDNDWSGAEDDDGNHSDWEKMPRPPQSHAAMAASQQQQQKQQQQQHQQPSVSSTQPVSPLLKPTPQEPSKPKDENVIPEPVVDKDDSNGNASAGISARESAMDRKEKDVSELETSMSAFASGTNNVQPLAKQSSLPMNEPAVNSPPNTEVLPGVHDASGESEDASHVEKPNANLWSLHIPDDTASASYQEQGDVESSERNQPQPSAAYRQAPQAGNVNSQAVGSSSCAAAGGDTPSIGGEDKSGESTADGACGAAEMSPASSRPQPTESSAVKQLADESAASVQVEAEPQLHGAPLQDASSADVNPSAEQEIPEVSDKAAESVKPTVSSAQEPAPTPLVREVGNTTAQSMSSPDNNLQPMEGTDKSENVVNADATAQAAVPVPSSGEDSKVTATPSPVAESVPAVPPQGAEGEEREISMKVKGDMVVVGGSGSPSSSETSETKEVGLDDDWEQDFDIEVTEEDMKAAEDIAKRLGENLDSLEDDDWENWE